MSRKTRCHRAKSEGERQTEGKDDSFAFGYRRPYREPSWKLQG